MLICHVKKENLKTCEMLNKSLISANSSTVFNYLNGIINVYKPAGLKVSHVRNAILTNLCKDLNRLEVRKPRERLCIEPGGAQNFVIRKVSDLADEVLAVGPRYQLQDIKCHHAANVGTHTSGVLVLGINDGTKQAMKIQKNRPIRVYHVTGCLGVATETHFNDSRVTLKASFRHIHSDRLSSMIASLQASHQRKMFEFCGVELESQAAYEIATKGTIRPAVTGQPVLYGIKVIDFKSPLFTLEVHAIGEYEQYLAALVHEIGIELRSVAHCTGIRCIRHGHFTVEDSLLRRQWNLEEILSNMNVCRQIIAEHPNLLRRESTELSLS